MSIEQILCERVPSIMLNNLILPPTIESGKIKIKVKVRVDVLPPYCPRAKFNNQQLRVGKILMKVKVIRDEDVSHPLC